jgi:hypothetical protein
LIVGFGAASGRHSMVMSPLTAPDKLCGKGFFVNEGANADGLPPKNLLTSLGVRRLSSVNFSHFNLLL